MEIIIKFISLLNDMTIKTLWVKGSTDTKTYLKRIVANISGKDVSEYTLSSNELGLTNYKSIANKVDILLVSPNGRGKVENNIVREGVKIHKLYLLPNKKYML